MRNPFRYFNSSPEVIRLTVMMYIRYPLSLRQVEDLLFERGIDICYETVRFWWNRFGPMFAAEFRKRRVRHRSYSNWRWHLDEVFVRINGKMHYLWRAVDHAVQASIQNHFHQDRHLNRRNIFKQKRSGLGNAAYVAGDLDDAEAAFRTAARRHPDAAAAWNNLAHVLGQKGRRVEAVAAAQRAVRLGGPNGMMYRETLREVAGG